jgi:hypothetical protein
MKTKKENKTREFNFTRNTISVESESAKATAIKFNCKTSKEFQENCTTWLKDFYSRNKSAKVRKENVLNCFAYQVKTNDLAKGGKYKIKNDRYEIDFYITPRGESCGENSGIYRKRQYIYFPQNDTIVLSDDVYTGFFARIKVIIENNLNIKIDEKNNFDADFGFWYTKTGKRCVAY